MRFTESITEEATLDWFAELGCVVVHSQGMYMDIRLLEINA